MATCGADKNLEETTEDAPSPPKAKRKSIVKKGKGKGKGKSAKWKDGAYKKLQDVLQQWSKPWEEDSHTPWWIAFEVTVPKSKKTAKPSVTLMEADEKESGPEGLRQLMLDNADKVMVSLLRVQTEDRHHMISQKTLYYKYIGNKVGVMTRPRAGMSIGKVTEELGKVTKSFDVDTSDLEDEDNDLNMKKCIGWVTAGGQEDFVRFGPTKEMFFTVEKHKKRENIAEKDKRGFKG